MQHFTARAILLSLFLCSPLFFGYSFANATISKSPFDYFDKSDPSWELTKAKNDIEIFTRSESESKFKAFKAKTIIDAPMADLLAVLSDSTSCSLWVDTCVKSGTLKLNSFADRYGYSVNDLPWPFKNRYLIVHILTSQKTRDGEIHITMTAQSNTQNELSKPPLNPEENVLLKKSRSHYVLTPLNEKQTEVIWMQHADPEGSLPSWLVNLMITELPLKSLKNLREIVQLPRYQNAELIYNMSDQLQGLKLSNGQRINQPKL